MFFFFFDETYNFYIYKNPNITIYSRELDFNVKLNVTICGNSRELNNMILIRADEYNDNTIIISKNL